MPGSFKGSKPGSQQHRTRWRRGGPSRVARLLAFRDVMYTRMEEVSFRTSMTVLAGVVAFAAVVAAVSTLMSVPAGPARHAALGRPAAPAAPSSAPATSAPPAPAPASPSSAPTRVRPSPVRDAAPAAAASAPSPAGPAPPLSPSPARISYQNAVAAWWSWWLRVHGGGFRSYRGGGFGEPGRGTWFGWR